MKDLPSVNIVMSGHIDHGKSTLIGRLLYDTGSINQQLKEEIEKTAKELGKEMEFAFFMDNLEEEREAGITIDTIQTLFNSNKYTYNIIDVPGHKEFIKNMITGASQADSVLLVVSAKEDEGIQEQTKRHMFLINFLGIKQVFVAVNKMDTVDFDEKRFTEVCDQIKKLLDETGYDTKEISFIPISAKHGDNISNKSSKMNWYSGPVLVNLLDNKITIPEKPLNKPLRMPVQDIYDVDGKMIIGKIETGIMKSGDDVIFKPSGEKAKIDGIEAFNQKKEQALPGESIGIRVSGIDAGKIKRGDVCGSADNPPKTTKKFTGQIFLLSDKSIEKNDGISIRCGMIETNLKIDDISRKIDSESGQDVQDKNFPLKPNEAGIIKASLNSPIVVEKFTDIPELGRFVITKDNNVVAAGTVLEF